jgi:hypothetical protein
MPPFRILLQKFTFEMPEWSKPGETCTTPSLNESKRRVVAFFLLLSQIPTEGQDAEETSISNPVSAGDEG